LCYFVGELHSPNVRTGAYAMEEQCQKGLICGAEVKVEKKFVIF
jgi:hypothetical protein